jgi:hypothetical protein
MSIVTYFYTWTNYLKKTPNPKCRLYWCLIEYSVYTYTGGEVRVWCHRRGGDLRQIKHLPQSLFTGQSF